MSDDLHFLCGGKGSGLLVPTWWLMDFDSAWVEIQNYRWASSIYLANSKVVRIWHIRGEHIHMEPVTTEGHSIVEQGWAELDASYHKFNNDNTLSTEQVNTLKGYMRGLCFLLAKMMSPHFRTPDEIVAECHKRHVRKQAGDTEYCTPGLGTRRNEMPQASAFTQTRTAPRVITHSLTEAQIHSIKQARNQGFTDSDLADMFKVSVAIIKGL